MFLSIPSFIFYCGNIMLATAYLVVTLLSMRSGGITGVDHQSGIRRALGVLFFAAGAALHVDIAIHTITKTTFFDDAGRIVWDFSSIVFVQMVAIVVSLVYVFRERTHLDKSDT